MKKRLFLFLLCAAVLHFSACVTGVSKKEAARTYYNLGNAYFELDKMDKAMESYLRAIELDDSLDIANYNLIRIYLEAGYVERGIEHVRNLLQEDPDNTVLLNTLAYGYTVAEDNQKAMEIYNEVLEKNELNKNALYNSGILYWKMEELTKAKERFQKLYRLTPDDEKLLYNFGLLELEMGNGEEGIRYINQYAEENPEDVEALTVLGNAYKEQEYYAKSLDVYNTILEQDTNKPTILFNKAHILLTAIGDMGEGLKTLERAVTAGFSDKQELIDLARDRRIIEPERVQDFLLEKQLIEEEELLDETSIENEIPE